MPEERRAGLDEIRKFHARKMAAASGAAGPALHARLESVFEAVEREAFVGPGPWRIMASGRYLETPNADPVHIYQNVLVALDPDKGINNGEPFLHAAWLGACAPAPGETVCHIGAGTGYYTAILSMLVLPDGQVTAFEIDEALARRARENLKPYENVSVLNADATAEPLPPSDLVYVNAGVVAPPVSWLKALRPGGRIIFPWQPGGRVGLTLLVTRSSSGFLIEPLMAIAFIPAVGASDASRCRRAPTEAEARSARSLWLTADRQPDETAVAVFDDCWFSSAG